MKINNIKFKNNLILAPMAGVTDFAFRSNCISLGADCGVTEMICANALKYENKKTIDLLKTANNEKIKVVQIFGHNPKVLSDICKSKYLEKFDIIDINMGCPTPKIIKNGDGCALMKNIKLASDIICACVNSTTKPITVKFRSGWDSDNINAVEFAKMCEKSGASAITIHARTRDQFYSGNVNLDIIKQVKESVNIPVIASGDVIDFASYSHMLNYTKCDAVMIGRGALGNPFIFSDILKKKVNHSLKLYVQKHYELIENSYGENFTLKYMRKHFMWYLKGIDNISKFKMTINDFKTSKEMFNAVIEILDNVKI